MQSIPGKIMLTCLADGFWTQTNELLKKCVSEMCCSDKDFCCSFHHAYTISSIQDSHCFHQKSISNLPTWLINSFSFFSPFFFPLSHAVAIRASSSGINLLQHTGFNVFPQIDQPFFFFWGGGGKLDSVGFRQSSIFVSINMWATVL